MKKLSLLTAATVLFLSSQVMYSADQSEAFVTAAPEADVIAMADESTTNWQGMYESDENAGGDNTTTTTTTEPGTTEGQVE